MCQIAYFSQVLGLDPHGQYSRVSLKVSDIWNAAVNNKQFPINEETSTSINLQKTYLMNNILFIYPRWRIETF